VWEYGRVELRLCENCLAHSAIRTISGMCCAKNTKRPCVDLRFRHDRISLGAIAFPNVPLRLPQDRRPALRRGWDVVEQYHDAGISGAKGRDGRPDLDQMLKDASRRKFDVIMVWAIDRLGRSLIC